ncbi:MAG: ATP-binding protein, partial [Oscillospiraceae bacterium]
MKQKENGSLQGTAETSAPALYDEVFELTGDVCRWRAPGQSEEWQDGTLEETLDWLAVVPEERETLRRALAPAQDSAPQLALEYHSCLSDGAVRCHALHLLSLPGGSWLCCTRDVTEADKIRRREEARLHAANRELQQALQAARETSESQSGFLARMSHELRTPMNAIIGLAELAASDVHNESLVLDCIQKSLTASRYLLSLINDILDMTRIHSREIDLKKRRMSCAELIDGVNTIIVVQARQAKVRYLCEGDWNDDRQYLGDITRLQQILINLLGNAIKFTPPGGRVKLTVRELHREGGKICLRFTVSDTGIGISQEFLPQLFQPFRQEHDGITTRYGGTGLGLAISQTLAKLMGGEITVESYVGVGTTFTVLVLLDPLEQEQATLPTASRLSGKRILLVEDHPLNTMVATGLLTRQGVLVDTAENGQAGLERFSASAIGWYDGILMDIRMPVMDGLTAAKKIRQLERSDAKTVPILA